MRSSTRIRLLPLLALAGLLSPTALGQTGGRWSTEFDRPGLSGIAFASVSHAGSLYAGGEYFYGGGQFLGGIARLEGSEWRELPGAPRDGRVGALESYGTELVVAGDFHEVDANPVRSITAWDGTTWRSFGSGIEGEVFDLAVYQGDLIAAGNFAQAGGQNIVGIARWDGAQWVQLGGNAAGQYNSTVWTLDVGPDGRLYAGGSFDSIGGVPLRGIGAWDGTAWSAIGSYGELIGTIKSLEWFQGQLFAGGSIDFPASTNENVVYWDGTSWNSTGGVPDWAIASTVNSLKAFDGYLFAGGNFRQAGTAQAVGIARFDGTAWSSAGHVGNVSPFFNAVLSLEIHGDLLVASGETDFAGFETGPQNGVVSESIAGFDGVQWTNLGFGLGFDAEVRATTWWNGGIAAVGRFTMAGTAMSGQVAWFDGCDWQFLGIPDNNVNDCVVFQGDLIITGEFTQIDGQPISAIARWDGTSWSSLGGGAGGLSLAVYQGELYAGGYGGFRRWNGVSWTPLINAGLSYVRKMHVHDDGLLYLGGYAFSTPNAQIFSYDGTTLSPLGSGVAGGNVEALISFQGGLIVGGSFTTAGGQPANRLARWDGSSWSPFGNVTGSLVRSLTVFQGELYAGGDLVQFSGDPADWIGRWDGSAFQALGLGLNGTPFTLLPDDVAGRLYVGGLFTRADWTGVFGSGIPSYYFGVWQTGPEQIASICLGDGSLLSCPCLNESQPGAGEGCANSQGHGAILSADGSNSVLCDDLLFHVAQARPNQPGMLIQGAALIAVPFKDGLLCLGNPTERLEVLVADQNGAGTSVGSVVNAGQAVVGETRYFQYWYRDPVISPCGFGSNLTNGLQLTWAP